METLFFDATTVYNRHVQGFSMGWASALTPLWWILVDFCGFWWILVDFGGF